MRVLEIPLLATLCLAACAGDAGKDDTGGGGEDSGGGGAGADDLSDLRQDLETGGCDDYQGTEIPGAASYFYGIYEDNGDGTWDGEEYWILYANPALEEASNGFQGECELMWVSSGAETDPGACPTCDLGLDVTLTLDVTQTTCPEDLYKTEMSATETYAVRREDDVSTWYFAGSGNEFGAGLYNEGAINFLTDKACTWF